jgi:hypothetical protein
MITLDELRKKASNLYPAVLRSTCTGEAFFPKTIPADKQPDADLAMLHRQLAPLVAASKERVGFGYTIRYERRKTRLHGIQDLPGAFVFETQADYLLFLEKMNEFNQFERDATSIAQQFPTLAGWLTAHPLRVVEYAGRWDDLLAVCHWFTTEWTPNRYYLRELTAPVHTKFVEQHKAVLSQLLDVLLEERVNTSANSFEHRFSLRYDEPLVRVRLLDAALPGFRDVSLPVSEFRAAHFPARRVFILENKMNFLAFPEVPEAAAIWGGGFQVGNLKKHRLARKCGNFLLGRPRRPRFSDIGPIARLLSAHAIVAHGPGNVAPVSGRLGNRSPNGNEPASASYRGGAQRV